MLTRREMMAAPLVAPAFAQGRRPPNVILCISDDQGYGDLSLHGNPHLQTPNLDRIGTEGVQFTQFQVCPVCSPTRSSLMTGRYNYRTGVVDTFLGRSMMYPDEVTLAEVLRTAGYRTGIFGKWHLGDCYPMRAMDQGFDESVVCTGGGLTQPSDPPGNRYHDPMLKVNGRWEKRQGYCTDIFFRETIQFIEKNQRQPFFAYLPTNAPHTPLEIEDAFWKPFAQKGLDEVTAKVYGMCRNLDDNMAKLHESLERLGLVENTILIFMTDNGPQQPRYVAGMRGRKGTVYQGGIRVPFFMRWPARLKPGRIGRIAAHIDVMPTLAEACGAKAPADRKIDGRSLMPLLARGRGRLAGTDDLHAMASRGCAGVVSGQRGSNAAVQAGGGEGVVRHTGRPERGTRHRGGAAGSGDEDAQRGGGVVSGCERRTRLRAAAHSLGRASGALDDIDEAGLARRQSRMVAGRCGALGS